ncbi:hypothetical protein JCM10213_000941 [Rhodosporidiobolus nylandii]
MYRTPPSNPYADYSPSPFPPAALPPLPPPPTTARSERSLSRGRSHARTHSWSSRHRDDSDEEQEQPRDGEEEQPSMPVGLFSRQARSATRAQRSRSYSQPSPVSPTSAPASPLPSAPPSPSAPSPPPFALAVDTPLFAPTFTPRQLARLSRSSARVQAAEHARALKDERRERKAARKGSFRAEAKIAMGVLELVSESKKAREKGRSRSRGRGGERTSTGATEQRHGEGEDETVQQRLTGVFAEVEEHLSGSASSVPAASSRPGSAPAAAQAGGSGGLKNALLVGGGAAALLGLAGAGVEWWEHEKAVKEKERQAARAARAPSTASGPPSVTPSAVPVHPAIIPLASSSAAAASITRPLSAPLLPRSSAHPSAAPAEKVYLSSLTPQEHHLVRHAAAALLLKDRARGTLHEVFHRAVGGVEKMVEALERGAEGAAGMVKGRGERPQKLFHTPLPVLVRHEGVDSHHGLNPEGTVRVPEFVDHCVTALKQMDCTAEGILRKSASVQIVSQIIDALDHSDGNNMVIDLAALDPITLADIFKKFLAALPDPVLTGNLFKLFIACSHISHPSLRRRAMHLVICLMPRVNRDVMEVVFLFLNWLSQYAHVDLKVGNQMDLSNIARVMAPTLLRPHHRDPKPVELPSMVAAVLNLLEDQHVLHEIPLELAQVLHIQDQVPQHLHGDSAGLVQHLARLL